jgi:hypothetical protein
MRSLVPLLFAFFVAAACGGSSSNSLQGPGSFSPNGSMALQFLDGGGGIEPYEVEVILSNSTPGFTCADFDAGFPVSAILNGSVDLLIAQVPTLQTGSFSITDPGTFLGGNVPSVGFAAIEVRGPTTPPSNREQETASSLSGSLTLTRVGNEWAGTFTAMMLVADAGPGTLTGTFDTSNICETQF